MEYRRLGKSGLKVSEIGLGGNNFGWRVDEHETAAVIRQAIEAGINFIDTADFYDGGRSEEFIGKALEGKRHGVVIATKCGYPMGKGPNEQGASRHYLMEAVDASLKRLGTDYIDLFQIHKPDPGTPIEETLRALDDLVRAGKVRYAGCSNFAAWQLCEALWTSRVGNLASFVTVQSRYNLFDRSVEQEIVPCCQSYGVGVIPWGPLAGGFLTGKYHKGQPAPPGTRLAANPGLMRVVSPSSDFDKLDRLKTFAAARGHSVAELAISWLLSKPWLSTIIAGATKPEQVSANVAAAHWKLTKEDTAELDKALSAA